jgi:membrane-anchored mycosin MYCP
MKQGVIEAYEEDQLVVALSDLAVVRGALRERAIGVADEKCDKRLGLALLTLSGVAAGATKLREDGSGLAGRVTEAKRPALQPERAEPSDLDLIIFWLRESFQSAYGGWVPTIGKNRVIEPVRGLPYLGGGGEGDPYFGGVNDPRRSPRANGGTSAVSPGPSVAPPEWPRRAASPGQGVRVGVLDTRLYPNEWLAGGYVAAAHDLLQVPVPGSSPRPASAGHATFIAGLILSRAPGAEIVIRPVLNEQAVGKAWDVATDMAGFIGSGVNILNLSFGCFTDDGEPPLVLARAVSLLSAEILLVAAAGNHGDIDELRAKGELADEPWTRGLTSKTPLWPAAFDEVIAVGATDGNEPAPFSVQTPWVDLTAPGVDVVSTYLTGEVKLASPAPGSPTTTFSDGFAYWDGTSFAAAAVSGAVAAKMVPGRCDARQALASIRESPEDGIRPYAKPGS